MQLHVLPLSVYMEAVLVEAASVMWDGREQTVIKVRIM